MTTHKTITLTADKSVINISENGQPLGQILFQFGGVCVQRWGDNPMTEAAAHAFQKTKGIAYENKAQARQQFIKFYDIAGKRLRIDDSRYTLDGGLDSGVWYDGALVGKIGVNSDGKTVIFADSGRAPDFLKNLAVGKTFQGYTGAKRAIIAAAQEAGFDDDIPPPANPEKNAGEPLLVDWKEYNPDKVINDQDLVNIRGLSALNNLSRRLTDDGKTIRLNGAPIADYEFDDDEDGGECYLDFHYPATKFGDLFSVQLDCSGAGMRFGKSHGGARRARLVLTGAILFYGL